MKKVICAIFVALGLLIAVGCQSKPSSDNQDSSANDKSSVETSSDSNSTETLTDDFGATESATLETPQTMDPTVAAIVEESETAETKEASEAAIALEDADAAGPITGDNIDKLLDEIDDENALPSQNLTEEDIFGSDDENSKNQQTVETENNSEVIEEAEAPNDSSIQKGSATEPAKYAQESTEEETTKETVENTESEN